MIRLNCFLSKINIHLYSIHAFSDINIISIKLKNIILSNDLRSHTTNPRFTIALLNVTVFKKLDRSKVWSAVDAIDEDERRFQTTEKRPSSITDDDCVRRSSHRTTKAAVRQTLLSNDKLHRRIKASSLSISVRR